MFVQAQGEAARSEGVYPVYMTERVRHRRGACANSAAHPPQKKLPESAAANVSLEP